MSVSDIMSVNSSMSTQNGERLIQYQPHVQLDRLCGIMAFVHMELKYRRAMTCAFMPDGSCFNGKKNILSQDLFESLEIGDLLENEEQNPLIWHNSWQ